MWGAVRVRGTPYDSGRRPREKRYGRGFRGFLEGSPRSRRLSCQSRGAGPGRVSAGQGDARAARGEVGISEWCEILKTGTPARYGEDGETEIDTAIREIKEETNIDVEIDSNFRKVISYSPKKGVMKDVVFFIGKAISFDLKIDPKELLDAIWVNPDEVKDYLNYQDTIWVFEEAVNYLRETGQLL